MIISYIVLMRKTGVNNYEEINIDRISINIFYPAGSVQEKWRERQEREVEECPGILSQWPPTINGYQPTAAAGAPFAPWLPHRYNTCGTVVSR